MYFEKINKYFYTKYRDNNIWIIYENVYCQYLAVNTRGNSSTRNTVFGFNILREVICFKTKIPKPNAKYYISDPEAVQSSFETYYKNPTRNDKMT